MHAMKYYNNNMVYIFKYIPKMSKSVRLQNDYAYLNYYKVCFKLRTEYIQFSQRSFQKTNRHGDGLIT